MHTSCAYFSISFFHIYIFFSLFLKAKYRDRAKERRELFGQPDSTLQPAAKKKKQKHNKV